MKTEQYQTFLAAFDVVYQAALQDLQQQFSASNFKTTSEQFFTPLLPLAQDGKRLRPYLISIGADSIEKSVLEAGVAFELLHLFALIHDDIMDGATMRRNVPTAHVAYEQAGIPGTSGGILLGDYLLGYSTYLMAKTNPALLSLFSEIQCFICIGQFYELAHWGKPLPREVIEQVELFKSAQYSFQYPLRIGLTIAGKDPSLLDDYAYYAGLAFQLQDDLLDINAEASGKDKGLDEKNGITNMAQVYLKECQGDVEKTKTKIVEVLTDYRAKGEKALPKDQLSAQQYQTLYGILAYFTEIR